VAEVDEERFPSSVEVDENQEQLFPIEAETADRVTLGKVRDDVDVTIGDVEVRAKRTEERIAGRDLRNDLGHRPLGRRRGRAPPRRPRDEAGAPAAARARESAGPQRRAGAAHLTGH
jgi:hypothetical protein